ncbi:hypothetical protein MRY87_01755 [bacterium]|nr:hypothetical protein [bacterium]
MKSFPLGGSQRRVVRFSFVGHDSREIHALPLYLASQLSETSSEYGAATTERNGDSS